MARAHATPKTYEEAILRLEKIITAMQNDELSLEDSLAAYKEGNELVKFCQEKLANVEQQLKILEGDKLVDLDVDNERN